MIGKTISHYKILAKLGEGGMGVVYKALDTTLNRVVALKFLRETLSDNTEEKARFMREARAAAALDHPNIATIHEIAEVEGQIFIAMAYIEGMTLKKQIARHALSKAEGGKGQEAKLALSTAEGSRGLLTEIIDIAIQISEGLHAAHEKGIVHRDIKSSNVMITPKGQVKITDFGLAKFRDEKTFTQSGSQMGTADYMSPEQIQGETIDHQSDIFSFGVVLYEMLTGQLPFQRENPQATMFAILYNTPRSVNELCPGMPSDLEQIVDRALEREKEDRYQSIGDLANDLQELKKKIVAGSEVPLSERKAKKSKQQKPELHLRRKKLESQPVQATERQTKAKMARRKRFFIFGGLVILAVLLVLARPQWFSGDTQTIDSIAVLPLENFTGDPEQDYFADGMTEALITDLGKIGALRVISRQSVMRFKGSDTPLSEIAQKLNVDAVVEGSVLRSGNQVRITAQLIKAVPEQQLWGDSYARDLQNVLLLQSEVAGAIAEQIRIAVTPEEQQRLASSHPVEPEAYQAYLMGLYYLNKRTVEGYHKAIEQFQKALDMDPDYALAYAGIADADILLSVFSDRPAEAMLRAKEAATKALQLDASLPEARTSLGNIKTHYEWNWSEAEQEYRHAIALNPNYLRAHYYYGIYLVLLGRFDEGFVELRKAQEIDPLSLTVNSWLGFSSYLARQYDQAIEQLRKTLDMEPDYYLARFILGITYQAKGMHREAIAQFETARTLSKGPHPLAALGRAYGLSGQRSESLGILQQLSESPKPHRAIFFAWIYQGLGDKDEAFRWLEKAYEQSDALLVFLKVAPFYDSLRSDARYTALLKNMRFIE